MSASSGLLTTTQEELQLTTEVDVIIGVAVNGVPIKSLATGVMIDELDVCGGHVDNDTGEYHYHTLPICRLTQLGPTVSNHNSQIGWALDGFPFYGPYGLDGIEMFPCHSNTTNTKPYCLDDCYGNKMIVAELDNFIYRYYFPKPIRNAACLAIDCTLDHLHPCCQYTIPYSIAHSRDMDIKTTMPCYRGCGITNTHSCSDEP